MVKRLLSCVFVFFICSGLLPQGHGVSQKPISNVTVINPWSEPIEVCYVLPKDGKKIIKITSGKADIIEFTPSIPAILKEHGYEIKDIYIWIHNHLSPNGFSKDDIIVYWYLRSHGFEGLYMLKNDRGLFYYHFEEK